MPRRERSTQRAIEVALALDDLGDPVAAERRVVHADVAAAPAVRDRRAAAHIRLEHGQAAGRVDERVSGREPFAHLLREADQADSVLACVPRSQPCAQLLVAPAQADDDGAVQSRAPRRRRPRGRRRPSRRRRRARPSRRRGRPSAARAATGSHGCANSGRVRPCTTWTSESAAGDLAHLLDRLGMDHEMQVDARRGPVVHRRQVGDRGARPGCRAGRSGAACRAPRSSSDRPRRSRRDARGARAAARPAIRTRAPRTASSGASERRPTHNQKVASQSHCSPSRKNTTPAAFSFTSTKPRPIARRPSSVTISESGDSSRSWSASVRAGRSWPSPTVAVKMRTRVTGRARH